MMKTLGLKNSKIANGCTEISAHPFALLVKHFV